MIEGIIFSNNSPRYLDEFFKSVKLQEVSIFDFCVIYQSDLNNEITYNDVFERYNISNTIKETDFKENLLNSISSSKNGLVAFFKDTNYFFCKIPIDDIEKVMLDEDIFCFSLSLGKNVKHDTLNDCYNILLNEENINDDCFKWNWVNHYLSFGRPLELGGGHIFHNKEIFKMFKKWKYNNVQLLEDSFESLEYYPKELMASFNHNILIDVISESEDSYKNLGVYDFSSIDRAIVKI